MTIADVRRSDPDADGHPEIVCAKCRDANPSGSNTCQRCGAHLWVACHNCGSRNQRIETECGECGHRLHRSRWKSVSKRMFGNRRHVQVWQVGLLIVGVWLAYRAIVFLAEF